MRHPRAARGARPTRGDESARPMTTDRQTVLAIDDVPANLKLLGTRP